MCCDCCKQKSMWQTQEDITKFGSKALRDLASQANHFFINNIDIQSRKSTGLALLRPIEFADGQDHEAFDMGSFEDALDASALSRLANQPE